MSVDILFLQHIKSEETLHNAVFDKLSFFLAKNFYFKCFFSFLNHI